MLNGVLEDIEALSPDKKQKALKKKAGFDHLSSQVRLSSIVRCKLDSR
jgi:hypothetical protein